MYKRSAKLIQIAKLSLAIALLSAFVVSRITAARPGPDISCGGPQCSGGCALSQKSAGRVHPDTNCCAVVGAHCMCVSVNSGCS